MDLGIGGKVAIVTGASRGLGRAAAMSLAREGCNVAICARGEEKLLETKEELHSMGVQVISIVADITESTDADRIYKEASILGPVDILVNNVGRAGGSGVVETTDDEWQLAFNETLYPAIRASRLTVPHLRKRGGGVILMIASIWGRESGGRMTYNAVKASEISLAKSMAQQLAADNIRVNSVAPGSISFPGGTWHRRQQSDPQAMEEFIRENLPFGRFGRAEEVGAVVAFLASPRASWISGASVTVDGCQSKSLF